MMSHQTYFKNQKKCRVITEESDQQKVSANPIGCDASQFAEALPREARPCNGFIRLDSDRRVGYSDGCVGNTSR